MLGPDRCEGARGGGMLVMSGVYFRQRVDEPLPTWGHGRRNRFWVGRRVHHGTWDA